MISSLCLVSCLLALGPLRDAGGPGPASANSDLFTEPRVGLSTREDVFRIWGKPASQRTEKNHTVCAWPRGRVTVVLTFNDDLDLLVDRQVVKGKG
jgi:hypothetical protein